MFMDAVLFVGGFRVGDGKNWENETLDTLVVSSKHVNYMFHDKIFFSKFLYSQVRNKSETYKWGWRELGKNFNKQGGCNKRGEEVKCKGTIFCLGAQIRN